MNKVFLLVIAASLQVYYVKTTGRSELYIQVMRHDLTPQG